MDLIHIIPNLNSGGAENFLLTLSTSLKNKYNQTIFTFENPKNDQLFEKFDSSINFLSDTQSLVEKIIAEKNSIIVCWMYPSIFFIEKILILNKLKRNIIWNIRHSRFRYFQVKQKLGLLVLALISRINKRHIIYCAYTSKNYHERYFFPKTNSIVILNGLIKNIKLEIPVNVSDKYLLYVGRYNHYKGSKYLIDIYKSYAQQTSPLKLKIIGSGWTYSYIPKKLRNKIEIHGFQSELREYYANASAFLFTSKSEGYPNVLAEACSFGLPIITTNAGDANVILEGYLFSTIVKSKKQFIKQLLNIERLDANKREEQALKFRELHSFKLTMNKYLEFFKGIS